MPSMLSVYSHRKFAFGSCAAALLVVSGCAQAPPSDIRAKEESTIRELDARWVKAAQTRQPEAWLAFYSPDAVVLPPNDKVATDPASIRKPIAELLALPELEISWEPTKVEVARSADIAYLYGVYKLSFTGPGGKRISDQGKNIEIWKKQADGTWKCAADSWSSDFPPAPPAPEPKKK